MNIPNFDALIQRVYGEDHRLVSKPEEQESGPNLPEGTRWWIVEHESKSCPHKPPCHWFGSVFLYKQRATLLKDSELPFLSRSDFIDRITGAKEN